MVTTITPARMRHLRTAFRFGWNTDDLSKVDARHSAGTYNENAWHVALDGATVGESETFYFQKLREALKAGATETAAVEFAWDATQAQLEFGTAMTYGDVKPESKVADFPSWTAGYAVSLDPELPKAPEPDGSAVHSEGSSMLEQILALPSVSEIDNLAVNLWNAQAYGNGENSGYRWSAYVDRGRDGGIDTSRVLSAGPVELEQFQFDDEWLYGATAAAFLANPATKED